MDMRRNFFLWCLVVCVASCFVLSLDAGISQAAKKTRVSGAVPAPKKAPAKQETVAPKGVGGGDAPITVDAKGAVLMEVSSGQTLFEQNADQPIEPASFTKVLTLYLVFEALHKGVIHLNDEVFISKDAWSTGGSKMFVDVASKVPVEELIKGIAVVSGNDACVAMAEHIAGSVDAFVAAMNQKAQELGMTSSHFMNPDGLPAEGQITTARDMARLDAAYIQHFPEALKYHSMHDFTYNNITQGNRNRLLLKDDTVDGLKTGYVTAAGYHLSATGVRDGMRLLAVVMGAANPHVREVEAAKLLSYGYHHYAILHPFPNDAPVATIKLWKGMKDQLELFPAEAINVLVPIAQKNALKWDVHAPEDAVAPLEPGTQLGDVVLYLNDAAFKTVPLVNREEAVKGGFMKRMWHSILRLHDANWVLIGEILGGAVLLLLLGVFIFNRVGRSASRRRMRGF